MFKFNIGETVKIEIFNEVKLGEVVMRSFTEDKVRNDTTYSIDTRQRGVDVVNISEKNLVEMQLLNI